jgi:hypothetical protein
MPSIKEIPVRFVIERAKAQDSAEAALPLRTLIADWYKENHYELEGYETLREIDDHFPSIEQMAEIVSMTEPVTMPGCVLGRFRTDQKSANLLSAIIHEIHRRMNIPMKESRKATRPEDVRQTSWTWPHVMRVMVRSGIVKDDISKSEFGAMIEQILGDKVKANSIRRANYGVYDIVNTPDFNLSEQDKDVIREITALFLPLTMPKKVNEAVR